MPKTLTIATQDFEFPVVGDNPDWGEQITDWATAVTDALTNVQQANDILTTSAIIANGINTPTSISGFSFDTSEVVSINAEYIIKRITTSPANNLVESGYITGNFDGSNWSITQEYVGDAEVDFTITSGGQIQYTSSTLSGSSYTGAISFKAKVFNDE